MARPKLKGSSVAIRLPVHLHDQLVAVAAQHDQSLRDYVTDVVVEHLQAGSPEVTVKPPPSRQGVALAAEFFDR